MLYVTFSLFEMLVVRDVSAHLHVIEIYVEGSEGLCEGFEPPWQSAESLCRVRFHGVIRLRAAAHWATQLSSCSHGQTATFWHTKPLWKKQRFKVQFKHLEAQTLNVPYTRKLDERVTAGNHIVSVTVPDSDIFQSLPVMPADLHALDSHTKHSGSGGDNPSCGRCVLEFILTSL